MIFYALHDYDKTKRGMIQIKPEDAESWNKKGYGIHWMPQLFKGGSRKTEDLIRIRYWLADIDNGDKETMLRRIACLPIQPTIIVETKRGYHCYWQAKDATVENYASIERGIAEALCADGSLITPTHTLRVPNYYHMKDPNNPFLIKVVWKKPENVYSEKLMMRVFKPKPKIEFRREWSGKSVKLDEIIKPENWEKYLKVSRVIQGSRNNEMNRIAYILLKEGADEVLMENVLMEINRTLNPPLDIGEIRGIVKGKFK
ncbi:MAG: hypothetical protein J6W29_03455 [Neisseriaceae bacterium]|nr:hypothetical protein [Neisseriaceae bacterium]